jgi:hypothetical protein
MIKGKEERAKRMYHEEKMIDGVLCWRGDPDGEFTPYTAEQLSRKYEQEKEQTLCLREIEDQLRAQLAKNEEVLRSAERLSKWNHNNLVNLNFTELNILSSELSDLSDAVRAAKDKKYGKS